MTIVVRSTPFTHWLHLQEPRSIHAVVIARDPRRAGARSAEHVEGFARTLSRVLVPGAHVVMRENVWTQDATATGLRKAGFEIRGALQRVDEIDDDPGAVPGFPNAQEAPRHQHEPWVLARWPCEGTVAKNLDKWHVGGFKRLSKDKPFPDVFQTDFDTFVNTVVWANHPLGVGTFLDPVALTAHTARAVEAAEIENAFIFAADARAYAAIQEVLDGTHEVAETGAPE